MIKFGNRLSKEISLRGLFDDLVSHENQDKAVRIVSHPLPKCECNLENLGGLTVAQRTFWVFFSCNIHFYTIPPTPKTTELSSLIQSWAGITVQW